MTDYNSDIAFNEMTEADYYIASLADPQRFQISIPDGNTRAHVLRSETITANITAPASGRGIFVLYPNHPGSVVGSHYEWNGTNYVNRSDFLLAQELKTSFNLVRKAAQVLTIRSSSIPSGVYALSGTMNVVQYDGYVSELSPASIDYSAMLSLTSDPGSKLGNILVGDGVAIVTIPDCSPQPYIRLDDDTPSLSTYILGASSTQPTLVINSSTTNSLSVVASAAFAFVGSTINGSQTLTQTTFNATSLRGFDLDASWRVKITAAGTGVNRILLRCITTYLDVFGNTLLTDTAEMGVNHDTAIGVSDVVFPVRFSSAGTYLPVAAVAVQFRIVNTAVFAISITASLRAELEVPNGELPGYMSPVTLVAYQGLAAGTVLTLSGVSNVELVPNADLLKNVTLKRSRPDADAWIKVQRLVSQGSEIGFNPVLPLSSLPQLRMKLNAIATEDDVVASAMSFKGFLRKVKKGARAVLRNPIVRSGLSSASRALGLPAGVGDQLIDAAQRMAESASGSAIMANSASGRTILPYAADDAMPPPSPKKRRTLAFALDDSIAKTASASMARNMQEFSERFASMVAEPVVIGGPNHEGDYNLVIPSSSRCVLFPTLLFDTGSAQFTGCALYAAVPGKLADVVASKSQRAKSSIYNFSGSSSISVPFDVTFVPVKAVTAAGIVVYGPPSTWVPVVGNSCDLALAVLAMWGGHGVFPYVVTGKVSIRPSKKGPTFHVEEQAMFKLKKRLLDQSNNNLRLIGNDPESNPPVTTVLQVLLLESGADASFLRSIYKAVTPAPNSAVLAFAMDEDVDVGDYDAPRSVKRPRSAELDEAGIEEGQTSYEAEGQRTGWEGSSTLALDREIARRVAIQRSKEEKPVNKAEFKLASRENFNGMAATFDEATIGSALERPWDLVILGLRGAQVSSGSNFAGVLETLIVASATHKDQVDAVMQNNPFSMATALVSAMLSVTPKAGGSSNPEAKIAREMYGNLKRKAETISGVLIPEYPFATPDWVLRNEGRGVTQGQAQYFARTKNAPEAGVEYATDELPAGTSKAQRRSMNLAKRRATNPEMNDSINELRLNQVLTKINRMVPATVAAAQKFIAELPPTPGKGLSEQQIASVKASLGLIKGGASSSGQGTQNKALGKEAALEILRSMGKR